MCALLLLAVLVVHSAFPDEAEDVRNVLSGTNTFAQDDLFDASINSGTTPTPERLAPYDAVLLFSQSAWQNAATPGTNLVDFFYAKGRVVVAVFAIGGTCACKADGRLMVMT